MYDVTTYVNLFMLLLTKHFLCEFVFRYPYQYENEHKYGHLGGISHAGLHTFGTFGLLSVIFGFDYIVLAVSLFEGVAHYHLDWVVANTINKCKTRYLTGDASSPAQEMWWLTGIDQWLHYMTYFLIVILMCKCNN
jgi:hypothetical protein